MVSPRVRTVIIAVVFGLLATAGVALYINTLRSEIVESGAKVPVFVALTEVAAGTPAADLVAKGLVDTVEIPKQYAATQAIGELKGHEGQVLAVALSAGEQVTGGKLRSAAKSELSHKLKPGRIALAIPFDSVTGVGGRIEAGDNIVILATFEPGPGGSDISRVVLKKIEVLAADGGGTEAGGASQNTKKTITVAVTPTEAEKLVFAQEKGKVWVGLVGAAEPGLPQTDGETMESIF